MVFQIVESPYGAGHKISLRVPDWVAPALYTYKVTLTITFNQAADPDTLIAPGTVNIDLKGLTSGRTDTNVAGDFHWSRDNKTAVFISKETLATLINPGAGENIQYTITVLGNPKGVAFLKLPKKLTTQVSIMKKPPLAKLVTVVTDSTGQALDGDCDGKPGGNFTEAIVAIG